MNGTITHTLTRSHSHSVFNGRIWVGEFLGVNGQEWADSHFGSVRHCFKAGAADFREFWFSLIMGI